MDISERRLLISSVNFSMAFSLNIKLVTQMKVIVFLQII